MRWPYLVVLLASFAVLAGCAPMARDAASAAPPEFTASNMRQYIFRSEFDETVPLMKARDWLGLSTLARRKLEREPARGEWWQVAGYGHLMAGELALARDCFARAARLLPEEVGIINLYAATLARQGDGRAAALAVERALQTDPTSTFAWVLAGDLHAAAGRHREALSAYERAIEIDRRDIFAWKALGTVAKKTGDSTVLNRALAALIPLYPPFAEELSGKP